MHGARNDFVVLDEREQHLDGAELFARFLCDRHAGIGADGLLLIGNSAVADATMRVINADGSEAEMCGNGIRCVARYLDERGDGETLRIETQAGIIATQVLNRGETYRVRADVGMARVLETKLPLHDAVVVDTGNPHVVWFRKSLDDVDLYASGEALQQDPAFPNGTNLHIARVDDAHTLTVKHYERGVGLTMACGTGAIACAAAAVSKGLATSPVTVHVPGGTLEVEIGPDGRAVMTGPAVRVFDAHVDVAHASLV
jgi:diaminopimelate epimerase